MATEVRKNTGRSWISGILLVLALVLTPTAIVANWATSQVTNTNNFVKTLSPLASNPKVQALVVTEITKVIDEKVDVQGITDSLFTGLGDALNLPDAAKQALGLVTAPIADGIEGMVHNLVQQAVESEAFQKAWTKTLTLTQKQTVALLSGDPNSAIQMSNDGTLTLPLKPIIVEIKAALVDQGVGFAKFIPEIDKDIVLGQVPELALARVIYQVGVGVGTWLPWIVFAFFVLGVFAAKRRPRALFATGIALTALMAFLAIGFNTGRVLATTLIESTYSSAVGVVYDALMSWVLTTIGAVAAVGVVALLVGWVFGASKGACAFRDWSNRKLNSLRKAIDPNNKVFVKVSPVLHQYRIVVRIVVVGLTGLVFLTKDPVTAADVLWAAFWALLVLFVYEVLQRQIAPVKKVVAEQPAPAKKTASAKAAPAKKTAVAAKPAAKKTTASKPAAKKAVAKKPVAKKTAAKKS